MKKTVHLPQTVHWFGEAHTVPRPRPPAVGGVTPQVPPEGPVGGTLMEARFYAICLHYSRGNTWTDFEPCFKAN